MMIKCKGALVNDAVGCNKEICCRECEKQDNCDLVCCDTPDKCGDAIFGENAVVQMKHDVAVTIKAVADLAIAKKEIEAKEETVRAQLVEAMEKYGVEKFDTEAVKFTYVKPSTRTTIDSAKLKKDLPDVAEKYFKTSNVGASVRIEVK